MRITHCNLVACAINEPSLKPPSVPFDLRPRLSHPQIGLKHQNRRYCHQSHGLRRPSQITMASITSSTLQEGFSTSDLLFPVLITIASSVLAYNFYSWRRLSHIPGPFLNSLTGFAMARKSLGGVLYHEMARLTEIYGAPTPIEQSTLNRMAQS
jgi:hypothetical protein